MIKKIEELKLSPNYISFNKRVGLPQKFIDDLVEVFTFGLEELDTDSPELPKETPHFDLKREKRIGGES